MHAPQTGMTWTNPLDADSDQMRLALELSGTGLWIWDLASGALVLSQQCRDIARWTRSVGHAQEFLDMVYPQDREGLQHALHQAANSGQALAHEFRLTVCDGAVVWVAMRGSGMATEGLPQTKLCGTLTKVAHAPPAQAAQCHAGELAEAAMSELPGAAAFVVDEHLRYLLAGGRALQAAGLERSHFEGRTLADTLPAEQLAEHEADYRRALQGESFTREHRVGERQFVTHGVPLRGQDGMVRAALAFSCDITAYKQAQEALQRSEALLSAVLDALPVGVVIADADGRIVRDNAAHRQLWGTTPPQTMHWQQYGQWEGYWPDTGRRIQAHEWAMARALHTGELVTDELVECVPFGSSQRRLYLNNAAPIRDAAGRITGGVVAELDVTQRMAVEQALHEREREMRALADNVPDILARFDRELRHVFVNGAVTQATGREPGHFIGRTNRELGMPTPLCDLWDTSILQVFVTAEPQTVEFEFDAPTGRRSYMGRFVPEKDPLGQVTHVLGIMSDVTTQRQAQLAVLQASRRKDEFLATLAHELRNPLAPMHTSLHLLRRVMPQTDQARQVLGIFERQVSQLVALVDDLTDVARIGQGKVLLRPQLLRLDEVLQTSMDACATLIASKGHQLTQRLPEQPVLLQADRTRLVQVFTNLLGNAAKYTPPGGEIAIEVSVQVDVVEVRFTDNGLGISAQMLPQVFELFTQSPDALEHAQGGLGIGLALVRRLIEMHHGTVRADSPGAGQGSTFTVTLPCVQAGGPPPDAVLPPPGPTRLP